MAADTGGLLALFCLANAQPAFRAAQSMNGSLAEADLPFHK